MKRARTSGGSLTGGTGDVKPQIFTIDTGIAASTDDYVVNTFNLPIPRFGTMKTKATVFEILAVDWYLNLRNITDDQTIEAGYLTTGTTAHFDGETATQVSIMADVTDPKVFATAILGVGFTSSGQSSQIYLIHINLTDNNGNGVLIATDRLTIVGANVVGTNGGSYTAKILYRMTNVGVAEYVGIVQSQQ